VHLREVCAIPSFAVISSPPSPGSAPVYTYPLGDALYLNLTSACTLACTFCPKIRDQDFTVGGFDLRIRQPPSAEEVWASVEARGLAGWSEVVFTGLGEPTHRLPVLLEILRKLKASGVRRVRLDTDGLASLREGRDVTGDLAAAGLDAISISVNASDPDTYARVCPNRYGGEAWHAVCAFVRQAVAVIPEVTGSCVALPGLSQEACRAVVEGLGARFRWRRYDLIGRAQSPTPPVA
jgi:TatD DNase family protein